MQTLLQDLRYALRMLGRSPGFAAVAILTLALGIGANTAIFSVIDSVLLKSLPYPQPDRLVVLDEHELHTGEDISVAWPNFLDWRDQNRSFQAAAGYRQDHFNFSGPRGPVLLRGGEVTAPFFSLLGAKPLLGRTFTDAEDRPGANPTVVLGYSLWRNEMGADPEILGKSVTLGNIPYTVIGVMPLNVAEPDYFRTMEIPLIEGRYFTQADNAQTPKVIIINQTLARQWWPHESPLGKRIKQGWPQSDTPYREIVGVVGDLKQDGLDAPQLPEVFLPAAQSPMNSMTVVVRTTTEPMSLAASVQKEIQAVDPEQPVARVQPMTQYMYESLERRRFSALLLAIFGALALLLAAVGIYSVMAYSVAQRTHEFGVRLALGAQPLDVLALVVKNGLRLILAGIAIGLVAAFGLTRLMNSLLFGVSEKDPVTFIGVTALLGAVALAACYVPARRATRVDPMVVLRYE
jgi:hypothetical protein